MNPYIIQASYSYLKNNQGMNKFDFLNKQYYL